MRVVAKIRPLCTGLGAQLSLITALPLLSLALIALVGLLAEMRASRIAADMATHAVPAVFIISEVELGVAQLMQNTADAATETEPEIRDALLASAAKQADEVKNAVQRLAGHAAPLATSRLAGTRAIVASTPVLARLFDEFLSTIKPVWDLLGEQTVLSTEEALLQFGERVKPVARKLNERFQSLNQARGAVIVDADARMTNTLRSERRMLFVVAAGAIATTAPLAVFVSLRIRRRLGSIARTLAAVRADWDLSRRVERSGDDAIAEIGEACSELIETLESIISDVRNASADVASASTQIAASNEELSHGMQNQQRRTSQVSSAVEEMSVSISDVARKAQEASAAASTSGEHARQGGDIVRQTVHGMEAISQEVMDSAAAVGELGKRGEQIGAVIAVINDIADQTNLLALNAAIEAARAGEHGRGFAVVADEVRKLAERTTRATEEVAESIKAIQGETTRAVERMQSGTARVDEGVTLARRAGDALTSIVESSQRVATMIQEIAGAAEQQSAASGDIARNVEQIDAVTNESAEGVQQASRAASQLSQQAEELQRLVSRFRVGSAR